MEIDQPPAKVHVLSVVPFEFQDDRKDHLKLCSHRQTGFIVNSKERTLRCKACDGEVDPYLAISRIADGWERWAVSREHNKQRADGVREKLADLEREERNCRARLAGLRKQLLTHLPEDLAEAIALLRNKQTFTREWERRRVALLDKFGGAS